MDVIVKNQAIKSRAIENMRKILSPSQGRLENKIKIAQTFFKDKYGRVQIGNTN